MADETNDSVTVDRSGDRPVRKDSRGVLHMIHDELGKALGIGAAKDRKVNAGDGKMAGLMDTVDKAVADAPAPGSEY